MITVSVQQVSPSPESVVYALVRMIVRNTGSVPCRVVRYRVGWDGGSAEFEPRDLVVPPNAEVERTTRVWPDTPGFEALMQGGRATAEALEVRPAAA